MQKAESSALIFQKPSQADFAGGDKYEKECKHVEYGRAERKKEKSIPNTHLAWFT